MYVQPNRNFYFNSNTKLVWNWSQVGAKFQFEESVTAECDGKISTLTLYYNKSKIFVWHAEQAYFLNIVYV